MKTLVALVMFAGLGTMPADEMKLGAGVTLAEPTPITAVVKAPADYVGKTIRVDGIATAVCQEMGCWLAVSDSEQKDAPTIRLQVEHEGAIVFPMSAKGKHVSAEGVFEAAGDKAYQIKATGAVIK